MKTNETLCDSHTMNTWDDVNKVLKEVISRPNWHNFYTEYRRLLDIIGNVEDSRVPALAIVALRNCKWDVLDQGERT